MDETNNKKDIHESEDVETILHDEDTTHVSDDDFGGDDSALLVAKLKKELQSVKKERAEYLDGWQRTRADLANFKREQEESRKGILSHAKTVVVSSLFPAIDSFSLAFANKEAWEKVDIGWRRGVEYIYSQLLSGLRELSIEQFGEVGEQFNPERHESVGEVGTDDDSKADTVAEVVQKGYVSDGKTVIRPAKVRVFQKNS